MRRALISLFLALAATPAFAHDQPSREDLRCAIVTSFVVGAAKPEDQTVAALGVAFYFGKLRGRGAPTDLEGAILRELETFDEKQFEAEAKRCGEELQVEGRAMQNLGERLKAADAPQGR